MAVVIPTHKPDCRSRVDEPCTCGESPLDVVGHKTMMDGSHVPLLRAEAEALHAMCEADKARLDTLMPSEDAAIQMLFDAYTRLKDFGWRDAIYSPKDGSRFLMIEVGSTGQHLGHYEGDWPTGYWTDGDCTIRPCLHKLLPGDEEIRKAKMAEAARRFAEIDTN